MTTKTTTKKLFFLIVIFLLTLSTIISFTNINNIQQQQQYLSSQSESNIVVPSVSSSSSLPTAAICIIVKSQLYDFEEWVDYHLALGFNQIYIYENSEDFDLQVWVQSKQKLDYYKNKLQVKHFPLRKKQRNRRSVPGQYALA